MLAITSHVALCQDQRGLFAFNNTRLVSIWCTNNGGQAKLFHHSSGSLSYINSLSTCAHSSVLPLLTYHRNSRLRIWKLSASMSQSIEVVGCRVAGRPYGELWGVFDQLSLDTYIQLHPIPCNAKKPLYRCVATFTPGIIIYKKFPNVINFKRIDCCRF